MNRQRALAFATLLFATTAFAQARLPERTFRLAFRSGALTAAFSARDLADDSVRRSLGSGLQKTFLVTTQTYVRGSTTPIAAHQFSCRVTYDLWEEAYVVRRGRRSELVRSVDAAVERCLVVPGMQVADAATVARHRGDELFVAVRAEFNPITASACARSLRRPGGDDPLGPFVVNIVRDEICQADRAIAFRSAMVRVP